MFSQFRPALVLIVLMTVLTGIAYPLLVTAISQVGMPGRANGSLIVREGKPVGSSLIGQPFADPKHFWTRPSATSPYPYNASSSSGSNQGPTNPALTDAVAARIKALRDADPGNARPVPVDLVTASASGLDPEESLAAALYQAPRISRLRNLDPQALQALIGAHAQGRWLGLLGEPRVNVLELNLALDSLATPSGSR
jgi:potassium-transporting ATPase KdpC subunit